MRLGTLFAPVLQTFHIGIKSDPNIFLPFREGLLYSMVTLARPTSCVTVEAGLAAGVLI